MTRGTSDEAGLATCPYGQAPIPLVRSVTASASTAGAATRMRHQQDDGYGDENRDGQAHKNLGIADQVLHLFHLQWG